ncbi:DUF2071 domain-containing protein [Halobacteria archaeon AArc-m2/3/4]|uniref:DUF2071 domain-containing protein n=1 Tax=Natronoglomus mannanivorans TaxID=2979990 RepID=A0ABT2QAH7_9EURY|nr:DUF2071 domain-containing protein [Halobacteria archaeon AArc-m2/3/4]
MSRHDEQRQADGGSRFRLRTRNGRSTRLGSASGSGTTRNPRPSPLPHIAAMTWRDGAFIHWPVDPDAIRSRVPEPLEVDTYDGKAWLSVLPFVLARAGLRGTPSLTRLTTPELNVRTYVRYRGDPGLFFFSVDLGSQFVAEAVGRLARLPCHHAMMHVGGADERVAFSSSRTPDVESDARFSATYRPDGEVFYAEPDSLAHWLTARRRFYAPSGRGRGILTAEIAHAPWPLQPVELTVHENTMFEANGLPEPEPEPDEEPVAYYCGELSMTGSIPRRISRPQVR